MSLYKEVKRDRVARVGILVSQPNSEFRENQDLKILRRKEDNEIYPISLPKVEEFGHQGN